MTNRHGLCGLDFGTSNSTLAIAGASGPALVQLEGADVTVPSAIFYGFDAEHAFLIGRAGVRAYVDGVQGRLLRSLKSILGSPLVHEKTPIYRKRVAFSEIIRQYISELKLRAERKVDHRIDRVVMGRPVHFVNNDPAGDQHAEDTLAKIARDVGFKDVSFQFEPVAAALDYERQVTRETLVLIADIGGGTSDFTVVRLSPQRLNASDRASDILANDGTRLGGTDYDRYLSMHAFMPTLGHGTLQKRGDIDVPAGPYWDLSTWSSVHTLYDPKRMYELKSIRQSAQQPELVDRLIKIVEHHRAHSVLMQVEDSKIALSQHDGHEENIDWIAPGLVASSTKAGFERATLGLYEKLQATTRSCLQAAGVGADEIGAIYFTGGTSQIPAVREAISSCVPNAAVVDGDRFGSVGLGLAVEATRRYA